MTRNGKCIFFLDSTFTCRDIRLRPTPTRPAHLRLTGPFLRYSESDPAADSTQPEAKATEAGLSSTRFK